LSIAGVSPGTCNSMSVRARGGCGTGWIRASCGMSHGPSTKVPGNRNEWTHAKWIRSCRGGVVSRSGTWPRGYGRCGSPQRRRRARFDSRPDPGHGSSEHRSVMDNPAIRTSQPHKRPGGGTGRLLGTAPHAKNGPSPIFATLKPHQTPSEGHNGRRSLRSPT
jgi:hypothetical protein